MMSSRIHYFGIRHHGPGSCKRLLSALEALQPHAVLIEGPQDATELLPFLAHNKMQAPVALLAYHAEETQQNLYYPFANFSPEFQAARWALKEKKHLAFIDLPINIQLAQMQAELQANSRTLNEESEEDEDTAAEGTEDEDQYHSNSVEENIIYDPIGALAKLANYDDGEAWWNDLIEQNSDDSEEIFKQVEFAMQALRTQIADAESKNKQSQVYQRDLVREAYMRLEIARAEKEFDGPIAVVCGAWHAPALREKHSAKDDRELLKQLPTKLAKSKVKMTWVPWTTTRLASASGYAAGVAAPMWYEHLWQTRDDPQAMETWLTKIARHFRKEGHYVSTASVIEALRLSYSLAAVRLRPQPGFEEIREATIACLCFGESLRWQQLEAPLLLGKVVGQIPDDVPLAPLLEDLQLWQKRCKLKPEALEHELAVDLRSDSGLLRSTLLHRLNILGVEWGRIRDSGKSRGTFRENWLLAWQPEFAVNLVENLVYGSSIEQAANNKICEQIQQTKDLTTLARAVFDCLQAQLQSATLAGLEQLSERAAHTSDCIEILESLVPLVDIQRYGTARKIEASHVSDLIQRLTAQASIALPYACRNINNDEAVHLRQALIAAQQALNLAELHDDLMLEWWQALHQAVDSQQTNFLISGLCAQLLYQAKQIDAEALQTLMQRMLSPALKASDAAQFFEGFFSQAIDRLLFDSMLLQTVETWLLQLEEESFVEFLPLFRRVFSGLDAMERKRLIDTVLDGRSRFGVTRVLNTATAEYWPDQLARLDKLFKGDSGWMK